MKSLIRSFLDAIFSAKPEYREKLTNYLMAEKLPSALKQMQADGVAIDVIYDIGARHGEWAKWLKKKLKTSEFFLFEANEGCAPMLEASGFKYFIGVLSSSVAEVDFYEAGGTGDSYYKENTPRYEAVVATKKTTSTLDSVVLERQLPRADLIKIDTQGSELDILHGGMNALHGCSLVYLECPTLSYNRGAPNVQDYIDFLDGYGFVPHKLCEAHYSYGALVQVDVLFARKEHLRKISPHVPRFLT